MPSTNFLDHRAARMWLAASCIAAATLVTLPSESRADDVLPSRFNGGNEALFGPSPETNAASNQRHDDEAGHLSPISGQGTKPGFGKDASMPLPLKLKDGRSLIEASPNLVLKRIPAAPSGHPITHSVTQYETWNYVCESRDADQACFASAFTEDQTLRLMVKFGIANDLQTMPEDPPVPVIPTLNTAPDKNAGNADKKLDPSHPKKDDKDGKDKAVEKMPAPKKPPQRYVMSIEGPPGLDTDTGYIIIGPHSVGALSLEHNCDRNGCRAVAEIDQSMAPLFEANGEISGFAIMASASTRTFLWKLSANGLKEAFDKARSSNSIAAAAPIASLSVNKPEAKPLPINTPKQSADLKDKAKPQAEPAAESTAANVPVLRLHRNRHAAKPRMHHEHYASQSAHFIPGSR